MKERSTTLGINLAAGLDADAEQVADATLQLRRELLDLDVDAVELSRAGEPPPGTRAVELAALGHWWSLLASRSCSPLSLLRFGPGLPVRSTAASSWNSAATSWS